MSPPLVATSHGPVQGRREGALAVFRGIPFAAPPTGERRFLPPAPPTPWAQPRGPLEPGPAPPQVVDPLSGMLGLGFDGPIQENSLHLNVWTPEPDGARRPVMLWLHGGAFATGTGTSPAYEGARLAERGDVVVVTLNYRVGALGFLHLAPLLIGAPEGAGANLGLLDQIAALKWIQQEIAAFGGDPDCVTIFGESAGAGSLVALLAMPAARGLFRRAIVQSPAPDGMLSADEGRDRAVRFLSELGIEPAESVDLALLQGLPLERILEAQRACIDAGPHRTGMFFAPVIGDASLPERPLDAIAKGSAQDVELLIGTTEEEMQLYSTVPGLGEFPDEILVKVVASRLDGDEAERDAIAQRAIDVYRKDLAGDSGREVGQQELFFALESDLSLRVPSIRLAESQASFQPRTFMYLFQWRSPMTNGHGGTLGACHALDLPFVFGSLDREASRAFAAGEDGALIAKAAHLSGQIMDSWTAFARTGDPSHPGIGSWPPYDTRRTTMLLGESCEPCEAPLEARRAVWPR